MSAAAIFMACLSRRAKSVFGPSATEQYDDGDSGGDDDGGTTHGSTRAGLMADMWIGTC